MSGPAEDFSSDPLLDGSTATHEGEDHPDERWLVSYADMMTLLFGLFVMLYSMASRFDLVQKSASKEFAKPDAAEPPKPETVQVVKAEYERLQSQLADLQKQSEKLPAMEVEMATLQKDNTETQQKLIDTTEQLKILKRREAKAKPVENIDELKTQIKDLEQANEKSKQELTQMRDVTSENEKLQSQFSTKSDQNSELQQKTEALTKQRDQLSAENKTLKKTLDETKQQVENLKQDAKAPTAGPFAAVVITWPTQNHDIDLIITDPQGKSFSYKHRAFDNHPGQFVLDTRRGPGAEMWQSKNFLPGIYQIKYFFYNTYGNESPAPISGTIYSEAGITELPKVKLKFSTQREKIFQVKISEKGEVTVLH